MSWIKGFHEDLAKWLQYRDVDAVEVLSFKEETEYGGYCDTCAYEITHVHIRYLNSVEMTNTYEYYGNMAEFIDELTS